jgi:hypothetical protein
MANKTVAYSVSEKAAAKAEWTAYDEAAYSADWKDFVLVATMAGTMETNMAEETVAKMDDMTVAHAAAVRGLSMVDCLAVLMVS